MRNIKYVVVAIIATFFVGSLFGQIPLQFTSTEATIESAVQFKWNSEPGSLYRIEYADEISDTATQWKKLYENYPSQGTNTLFMDAGVYYQGETVEHPRNFPQRFYRVVQTGTNDVTPPAVVVTSPTNGFVASGLLNISIAYTSSLPVAQIHIFVDGEEVRVSGDASETNFFINTCEWPNGPHIIYATMDGVSGGMSSAMPAPILFASGTSPMVHVNFNNFISQYTFTKSWFQPSLGQTQNISAKFAAYADWQFTILDPQSNVVRTAVGTGYNMNYDWDGTDQSNNPTLDGQFSFFLSASNSLSTPVAAPPFDGSNSPPTLGGSAGSFIISGSNDDANSVESLLMQVPSFLYPPGMELPSGPQVFIVTKPKLSPVSTSSSAGAESLAVTAGQSGALQAPSEPQEAPQPSRPETRRTKNTAGSTGIVVLQNYTPASNKPRKLIGTVSIDLNLPAPKLFPWPAIMAINFETTMKRGNYTNAFNKTDTQITAADLQGASANVFNTGVDFGLMVSHGARALQQDDRSTSTPSLQTYIPFPPVNGQYEWIPISKMKFGGPRLKWMGIQACNLLNTANYQDLYNKNLLPLSPNMHMFLSGSTTIFGNGVFGQKLGEALTGKTQGQTNAPATVWDAWVLASKATHVSYNQLNTNNPITITCKVRAIYWPDCLNDTIYEYVNSTGGSSDQSTSTESEETVFTPQ